MIEFAIHNTRDEGARLVIDGALLIYDAEEIKRQLIDALHAVRWLELDLSRISEMDTAGMQLLMLAKQESLRQDKTLRIVAHSPAVQEVIEFYNVAAFFGDPLVIPARDRESEHG